MKKVRWGVIGAGGIAQRRTIPGMMQCENAELIAVMEITPELAENCRAKWNCKKAYTSAEDLLNDPEIDAVYIASPVFLHAQQDHAGAERTELHTEFGDMYAREIESLSNSILTGSPLEVPASDAVQVQRVIELAYRSNDEKKLFDL